MINTWMLPRPKRRLAPVVDALSAFSLLILRESWRDRGNQLQFEATLERLNLKRPGVRRDQRAGGARTYEAWFNALGLTYAESGTGLVRLTLAGQVLVEGTEKPVDVLTHQLMKLQYPSPYSRRKGVDIHQRFRIRPFRFLLRLLMDPEVQSLSKAEIARFVITEAEDESLQCLAKVASRIQDYRGRGDAVLPRDLPELYPSSQRPYVTSWERTLNRLEDTANTLINYLEYTQLIMRESPDAPIRVVPDRMDHVEAILGDQAPLMGHDQEQERFQRHYGLPPGRTKDQRTFGGQNITPGILHERMVRMELLHLAGTRPIPEITPALADEIATRVGLPVSEVERILHQLPIDSLNAFEASFLDMAWAGRQHALAFEVATAAVFEQLGYHTEHVGPLPRHPDVVVRSPMDYTGIVDNKAYSAYSISNDHRNRMVHNYIPFYRDGKLAFFAYVAGGFAAHIDTQIRSIAEETEVCGSAITARDLVELLRHHRDVPIEQGQLKVLFQANRRVIASDITSLEAHL